MKFNVIALRRARNDYHIILGYLAGRTKQGAVAWAKAYDKALQRLETTTDTLPLAPENEHVDMEVREILFKTHRELFYRAICTIQGSDVYLLHVRGPGQDLLTSDELGPPDAG